MKGLGKVKAKEPKDWNLTERYAFKRGMLASLDSLLKMHPEKRWIDRRDVEAIRDAVADKRR